MGSSGAEGGDIKTALWGGADWENQQEDKLDGGCLLWTGGEMQSLDLSFSL